VHDYPREDGADVSNLPQSCGAIDFYIGDPTYIGRGLGAELLTTFLSEHIWPQYDVCFVDPEKRNVAAIKTYQKAGFVSYNEMDTTLLMVIAKSREA
jgi:aminoglycoside 6'-N-acetyltransferase